MMQVLNRQHEQLRAGVNYHLLGAMRRIEERDRQRFAGSGPVEKLDH
jgi:hypothetical protein